MQYSHVIWDWNGTLLEDMHMCIEAMNQLLAAKGLPCMSGIDAYRKLFCFPVQIYYSRLNFNFNLDPFETLAHTYIENYARCLHKAQLYQGAQEVLKRMHEAGMKQLVLSASQQESLESQMQPFPIHHYFEAVLGIDNPYAASKVDRAKQWMAQNQVNPCKVVCIGDTVHDFEVSQALGCGCILIANGHQSLEMLQTTAATIVGCIQEVESIFWKSYKAAHKVYT